jgi:chemotaxis protein MotB
MSTGIGTPVNTDASAADKSKAPTSEEEARKAIEAADHKKLESLMQELRQAIDMSQALKPFKDQLLLDITPEGLRIQIVDAQNRPMFDLGSAKLRDYTGQILHELAPYLSSVPNRISVSGHTDTTPYAAAKGETNWDLSADRANAARRALEGGGLSSDKIARIVGLSSSVLFDKENPRNPINRRISIIVMTQQAEEAAAKSDAVAPQAMDAAPAAATAAQSTAETAAAIPASAPAPTPAAAPAAAAAVASPTAGPIDRSASVAH